MLVEILASADALQRIRSAAVAFFLVLDLATATARPRRELVTILAR